VVYRLLFFCLSLICNFDATCYFASIDKLTDYFASIDHLTCYFASIEKSTSYFSSIDMSTVKSTGSGKPNCSTKIIYVMH
jgi:hypothetical protein